MVVTSCYILAIGRLLKQELSLSRFFPSATIACSAIGGPLLAPPGCPVYAVIAPTTAVPTSDQGLVRSMPTVASAPGATPFWRLGFSPAKCTSLFCRERPYQATVGRGSWVAGRESVEG